MSNWPELLLIDKPHGSTSFDVIRRLRRIYSDTHGGEKAPKLGHAGTLDPLATGLMLLGVGSGTKKLAELIKLDKEYLAEIRLGESRTTGDMEGEIVDQKTIEEPIEQLQEKMIELVSKFPGVHTLPVSAYSAIKVDGVPMYKRARKAELTGDTVLDIPMREMTVHKVQLKDVVMTGDRALITIRFQVASGTYIRSLAEEIGRQLGYPACLQNLRRTKVGEFSITDAYTFEDLK